MINAKDIDIRNFNDVPVEEARNRVGATLTFILSSHGNALTDEERRVISELASALSGRQAIIN